MVAVYLNNDGMGAAAVAIGGAAVAIGVAAVGADVGDNDTIGWSGTASNVSRNPVHRNRPTAAMASVNQPTMMF